MFDVDGNDFEPVFETFAPKINISLLDSFLYFLLIELINKND
jgi:hypothetical protein